MKLAKKPTFEAFKMTLFLMASIHLLIIAFYAVSTGKFQYLHMGDILDIKFLIPGIAYTLLLEIILGIIPLVLFIYFYKKYSKS